MRELASTIRDQLDILAEECAQRLGEIAESSDSVGIEVARSGLELVAACLDAGDDTEFIKFIQRRANECVEQGFGLDPLMQELTVLEEALLPLVTTVETSKFLWRMLSRARTSERKQAEAERSRYGEALRESQQMLQLIMDNIPQSIFWKDVDLVYLGCNQGFAEGRGLGSPDHIVGKTDFDLSPTEQAERFRADDRQVMKTGVPKLNYEEPRIAPDGEQQWLRTSKVPLRDAAGNVWAVLGMYEDITDRKQSELELQRLARAVESTRDAVVITDLRGDVLFVNPAFEQVTGYSVQEALGENPRILKSGVQDEATYAEMWQAITSGQAWEGEVINRRKDGMLYNAQLSISPIFDEQGNVEQFVAIQRDVTEQRRVEEDLLRLQSAVEQSIDGIAVTDVEGNIQFVNPAWAQMHGYNVEELSGKHLSIFHTEEQLREDVASFNERVIEFGAYQGEVGHVGKDGATFPTWMATTLLKDEGGNPVGLVGTARDISEQKRVEREREETYERRVEQVQVSVEISQELAAVPALGELFRRVVTLVKERFGYYHVQLFQYEPALNAVVMVTGYGRAGEAMLAEGHSLELGHGVVGVAAVTRQSVLAADVRQDVDWVPNPHLPETRGELAVPIMLRDQVLGILDVQHDVAEALDEDDRLLLEAICGPVALAIESTRLRQEMEDSLRELRSVQRTMSQEGWETFRETVALSGGYLFDRVAVQQADDLWVPEIRQAVEDRATVSSVSDERPEHAAVTVVPVLVQDEPVGVLGVYDDPQHPLSPEDIALVESVSEQVSMALESARLSSETQSALAEARTLYSLSELISGEADLRSVYDSVARSLVEDLGYATSWIATLDEEVQVLEGVAGAGLAEETIRQTVSLSETRNVAVIAVRERTPVLINDPLHDERLAHLPLEAGTRGKLAEIPILVESDLIGVIAISRPADEVDIGERDVRILQSVATQVAVATQRARFFEQTQAALAEVEATHRRYLRETWDTFLGGRGSEGQGYIVDPEGRVSVQDVWTPEMESALASGEAVSLIEGTDGETEQPRVALAVPLKIRGGQTIGVVNLYREGVSQGWTEEEQELIQALSEQIADSIEGERLFETTQTSLAETARLYEASRRISEAQDPEEIFGVVLDTVVGTAADRAIVLMFDKPVTNGSSETPALTSAGAGILAERPPQGATDFRRTGGDRVQDIVAFWDRDGAEPPEPLGTRYTLEQYPVVFKLSQHESLIVPDVRVDERLDDTIREMLGQMGIQAAAFVPLSVGNEWLGYVAVMVQTPHIFTSDELRVYQAVSDQAAIALRSQRLLREARSRARREELIREITSKMRGTVDLDSILNTAVQELGQALGVSRAFIRLSTSPESSGVSADGVSESDT